MESSVVLRRIRLDHLWNKEERGLFWTSSSSRLSKGEVSWRMRKPCWDGSAVANSSALYERWLLAGSLEMDDIFDCEFGWCVRPCNLRST